MNPKLFKKKQLQIYKKGAMRTPTGRKAFNDNLKVRAFKTDPSIGPSNSLSNK